MGDGRHEEDPSELDWSISFPPWGVVFVIATAIICFTVYEIVKLVVG